MGIEGIRAAITLGDPCGVGPELVLETLSQYSGQRIAVLGSPSWIGPLLREMEHWNPVKAAELGQFVDRIGSEIEWVDVGEPVDLSTPGKWNEGNIGFIDASLKMGLEICREQGCGLVTGPVDKRCFIALGMKDSGHTEYLVRQFETPATMYFDSPECRLALMTRHIPLVEVSSRVEKWLLQQTVEHVTAYWKRIGEAQGVQEKPMAVVGVDPHCGEWGLISELDRQVRGWVEELHSDGLPVVGPISADTAFLPEVRAAHSAALCWYHDQGMIPVKLLGFDNAVNVTLGLPVLRTSPAHGVAYDRAWKGNSKSGSFRRALDVAVCGGF